MKPQIVLGNFEDKLTSEISWELGALEIPGFKDSGRDFWCNSGWISIKLLRGLHILVSQDYKSL